MFLSRSHCSHRAWSRESDTIEIQPTPAMKLIIHLFNACNFFVAVQGITPPLEGKSLNAISFFPSIVSFITNSRPTILSFKNSCPTCFAGEWRKWWWTEFTYSLVEIYDAASHFCHNSLWVKSMILSHLAEESHTWHMEIIVSVYVIWTLTISFPSPCSSAPKLTSP